MSTDVVPAHAPWSILTAQRHNARTPIDVIDEQATAIARLPLTADRDPFERLAAAFLAGYSANSARAYRLDLRAWWSWCNSAGVHPFDARRHHVDAWVRALSGDVPGATQLAPASIRRRLSAVSKFYKYGIEVGALVYSPVDHVRRPKAPDETATVGLSIEETDALLAAAEAHSPRFFALVSLLVYNGLRIDEALAANVEDYSFQRGHRVLVITRKGGTRSTTPLAPPVVRALDDYLAANHPLAGSLFLNRTGTERLAYMTAYAQIRRLASRAEIPGANSITPHSMRHTFITECLAAGVPLQVVQDAAGHKSPDTTRQYDHNRAHLDGHPTYVLATQLRRSPS